MVRVRTDRCGTFVAHWITCGRLTIVVTNRPQLFEERDKLSVLGWWVDIIWRV